MKTRLLIIIGIIIILGIVGIAMTDIYQGQIEWKEKVGGLKDTLSIPSTQELLEMDCEDLNHLFPEFPSTEAADAWNTRMHECMNEKESLLSQTSESRREKAIASELEDLQEMPCDKIIQRNTEGEYRSSDNRKFAREKVGGCSDKQELPFRSLHYSSVLISAQTPQEFYTEDAYHNLLYGIYSNVVKENNFQLSDVLLQYQIDFCKLYTEKFDKEIMACDDIQITTQPYKSPLTTEELYDIIYQNEVDIINNIECSELKDTYDGKMHLVGWPRDMISNALNNCKDAGWKLSPNNFELKINQSTFSVGDSPIISGFEPEDEFIRIIVFYEDEQMTNQKIQIIDDGFFEYDFKIQPDWPRGQYYAFVNGTPLDTRIYFNVIS